MGDDITIGVTEIVNNIEVTAQPNDQIVDISVIDNADDVTLNITPTVIEINVNRGSSYAKWGTILGTLSDQTDLQNALDLKANLVGGKVPASELPSYVDDVVEVANYAALPTTGETGKIYVTLDNNKIYRWSGSVYIEIAANSAIWGAITGTLSSQTDLQNALNAKFDDPTGDTTQYIAGDGSLITFPIAGQSGTLVRQVRNTTGATLLKGTIVYINGANGNKPTVAKAIATGDSTSAQTFGMLQADISDNANGYVVCVGDIIGLDTSAITEGTQLYLSSTTAGAYTTTKQVAPAHLVYIGVVTRSHPTLGQIEVKIQNGYELDEIHDVLITSKANNQFLVYESATDLWKNKSLGTVLAGTSSQFVKGDGSLDSNIYALDNAVVHLTGAETITGEKSFNNATSSSSIFVTNSSTGNGISSFNTSTGNALYLNNNSTGKGAYINNVSSGIGLFVNNTTAASGLPFVIAKSNSNVFTINDAGEATGTKFVKSGGTSSQFLKADGSVDTNSYILSVAANAPLGSTGGTSPVISITQATTSSNGYLSSTDWNTFNNKVPTTRTLTINGTSYDLSADRSWTISAGISGSGTTGKIPLFTGSTALGDSSLTEFSTYLNLTKPLTIAYSTATSASGLNLSLNNAGSTGTTLYVFNAGTGNLAQFQKSDNTAAFLINSSGNVGIGTTSPTSTLNLQNATNPQIDFHTGANKRADIRATSSSLFLNSITGNDIQLQTDGSTKVLITSGGNVGIGTTSPAEKLHVMGNSIFNNSSNNGTTLRFVSNSNSLYGDAFILSPFSNCIFSSNITYNSASGYVYDKNGYGASVRLSGGSTNNGDIFFNTFTSGTAGATATELNRMTILNGGNVGIGTTSPSYKLDVAGAGGFVSSVSIDASSTPFLYFRSTRASGQSGYIKDDGNMVFQKTESGGGFRFLNSSSTTLMAIDSGGNVDIDTLGTGLVYSNSGVLTSTNPSDSRLKDNIVSLNYGLNEILKLRPVSYNWKNDNINQGKQFGFIAQEVQEVMPELVKEFETEDGERLGLDKEGIYAALVNAIQELKAEIEILKNK